MKKSYVEPSISVVNIQIQNVMQSTSSMGVGGDMSSGEGASRERGGWDDED